MATQRATVVLTEWPASVSHYKCRREHWIEETVEEIVITPSEAESEHLSHNKWLKGCFHRHEMSITEVCFEDTNYAKSDTSSFLSLLHTLHLTLLLRSVFLWVLWIWLIIEARLLTQMVHSESTGQVLWWDRGQMLMCPGLSILPSLLFALSSPFKPEVIFTELNYPPCTIHHLGKSRHLLIERPWACFCFWAACCPFHCMFFLRFHLITSLHIGLAVTPSLSFCYSTSAEPRVECICGLCACRQLQINSEPIEESSRRSPDAWLGCYTQPI